MLDFESLLIYSFVLFIAYVFAYVYDVKKNKFALFVSFLILALFSGLRYEVGFDYKGYVDIFETIRSGIDSRCEIGFYYLNLLFSNSRNGFIYVQLCMSFLTYGFLMASFLKYNKNIRFCIFFLFTFQLLFQINNQERQGLAICIFFYAMQYLESRKYFRYAFWIIFASLFHVSVLCLLILICFRITLHIKWWRILIVLSFILSCFGVFEVLCSQILNFILTNIPQYQVYLTYEGGMYTEVSSVHGTSAIIICLYWVIIALVISMKSNQYFKYPIIQELYYLGILLFPIFISFHLLERFFYYFIFISVLIASEVCSYNKLCKQILFILGLFVFIIFCLKNWGSFGGYPYKTVLSLI